MYWKAASGVSTAMETADAVTQSLDEALEDLGAEPGLVLVTCTVEHDAALVHECIRRRLPLTKIHGITTSLGVLSGQGIATGPNGAVGVMLFVGRGGIDFEVVSAVLGDDPRATSRDLALRLGESRRPSLVFFNGSPGQEEALLDGVADALPGVPLIGGSAADHAIAGEWSVFTNDGVHSHALSLAAIYGPVPVGLSFRAPYRPSGPTARVTSAEGRTLQELDGQPAAVKLRAWVGEGIERQAREGGNVLAQTALKPLALRRETGGTPHHLTIHPSSIDAASGAVSTFACARPGDTLYRMEADPHELIDAVRDLARSSLAELELAPGEVEAGLLIYCAGCAGVVGAELEKALPRIWGDEMPGVPLMGMCTFGEQARLPGVGLVHANLALGLVLLGRLPGSTPSA